MRNIKLFRNNAAYNSGKLNVPVPNVCMAQEENRLYYNELNPMEKNAVDLGLPSGTLWADRNIGAASPEDGGLYFQRGNVDGVDDTDEKGIAKMTSDNYESTPGYELDGDIPVNPLYDAARANLGAGWKMPTTDDFTELMCYCDWTWTERNGIYGYLVESKVAGNNNSIFLPAAGFIRNGALRDENEQGNYWSSTYDDDNEQYLGLFIEEEDYGKDFIDENYLGYLIRPIRDTQPSITTVDLGLPSGTLWGSMNLGANRPWETGKYFQWGDTQGYTEKQVKDGEKAFNWGDYKFNPSGDGETFTKYNDSDGKRTLDLVDDAAHVMLGGAWKMPTPAQLQELTRLCTWVWTSFGDMSGYKVTGPNGNLIFLPAAGYVEDNKISYVGTEGYYWESTLYEVEQGFNLNFNDGNNVDPEYIIPRYYGFSIRPIQDAPPQPAPTLQAVDLGLTSGTKWANMNLGATTPEGAGLYFQWGDTQGYTAAQVGEGEGQKAFDWSDYKFNPSGDGETMTKYNSTDGKTVLDPEDDAAHVMLGGDWQMPTPAQVQELHDECTWTWDENRGGYVVVGQNGNSIFIPAAGVAVDSVVNNVGSYGNYWESTLGNVKTGRYLEFASSGVNVLNDYRYYGISVRAVLPSQE